MKTRVFVQAVALALASALGGAAAQAQSPPSLVTDAHDYLPGETVVLMGSGFLPGETVDVSIAIDDDANNIHIGDYDWMVELADGSGDFMTFWTVPLEALGMTLRATALGLTSGNVATSTFYDAAGTHNLNVQIIGLESMESGFFVTFFHSTGSSTIIASTSGEISPSVAVTPGDTISYGGFPTDITVFAPAPGGIYNLVSLTPYEFGFTAGASGETTTVVATYSFTSCLENAAPTLSADDYSLLLCPEDGSVTVTVTPADFNPQYSDPDLDPQAGPILFADGTSSKTLTFAPGSSSYTLTLRAADDPSWRPQNLPICEPLQSRSTDRNVTISASIYQQHAPTVQGHDLAVNNTCVTSSVTIPVTLASFGASASDIDGDPIVNIGLNKSQVTLTLPPGVSHGIVSESVVISATDNPAARDMGECAPLSPMTGSKTVQVSAHLYRNTAPVITASNLNLGNIVGRLASGSFRKEVSVSPASFHATGVDAEGDPFTIVANVSQVTLIGPGLANATVVLTATDNPTARTGGACVSASSTRTVQVSARIVYRFDGPLAPLNWCVSAKVKRGSVVPVRFRLYDCNNVEVRTIPVNPAGGPSRHLLSVAFNQANAPDGAVDVDEVGCGDSTDDFHYLTGAWNFLLQTNSTYHLNTTYVIRIYPNDGTVYNAMISIKR